MLAIFMVIALDRNRGEIDVRNTLPQQNITSGYYNISVTRCYIVRFL